MVQRLCQVPCGSASAGQNLKGQDRGVHEFRGDNDRTDSLRVSQSHAGRSDPGSQVLVLGHISVGQGSARLLWGAKACSDAMYSEQIPPHKTEVSQKARGFDKAHNGLGVLFAGLRVWAWSPEVLALGDSFQGGLEELVQGGST